jgi:hypothetical protein
VPGSRGALSAVMTASTPGTARAPVASTERIVPRAITDGTAHTYAAPSAGYSKAYLARPVTLSGPSTRPVTSQLRLALRPLAPSRLAHTASGR